MWIYDTCSNATKNKWIKQGPEKVVRSSVVKHEKMYAKLWGGHNKTITAKFYVDFLYE